MGQYIHKLESTPVPGTIRLSSVYLNMEPYERVEMKTRFSQEEIEKNLPKLIASHEARMFHEKGEA